MHLFRWRKTLVEPNRPPLSLEAKQPNLGASPVGVNKQTGKTAQDCITTQMVAQFTGEIGRSDVMGPVGLDNPLILPRPDPRLRQTGRCMFTG